MAQLNRTGRVCIRVSDGALDPESEATTTRPNRTGVGARRIGLGLFVVCCAGLLWLWFAAPESEPPSSVSLLSWPFKIPPDKGPLLDRWIPQKWGWLWRIKYAVMGKDPVIHLRVEIFTLPAGAESPVDQLLKTRPPIAQTNGTRGWMLTPQELDSLREALKRSPDCERLELWRIDTGHRVQAGLAGTQPVLLNDAVVPVGLLGDFFTAARGKTIEVTAVVAESEKVYDKAVSDSGSHSNKVTGISTNFAVASKMWLSPNSNGVFVVQSSTNGSNRVLRGMLLSGTVERPK